MCLPTVIVAIIPKSQKEEATQVSLTDEWINEMFYIYTKDYNSALKTKDILRKAACIQTLKTLC